MLPSKKPQDLLFIDTETTGLDETKHELLEVAAIRTTPDGLSVLQTYTAKIKPRNIAAAETKALQINGYVESEWTDDKCVPRDVLAQTLQVMARDTVLVGQNVSFDEKFLAVLFREVGIPAPWGYHKIDTVTLAWPFFLKTPLEGLSLSKLATYLNVKEIPTHRALADAEVCRQVYIALMSRLTVV